jgi:hypothetical protein
MTSGVVQVRGDNLSIFYLDKNWFASHTPDIEMALTAAKPTGPFGDGGLVPGADSTPCAPGFDSPRLHLSLLGTEN